MLFAKRFNFFRGYHDTMFEMFWSHQIDIDELDEVKAVIDQLGGSAADFAAYALGAGRAEHDEFIADAEVRGVFGVPTMIVDDELFWGGDRIGLLKERLEQRGCGSTATYKESAR
jgi:2-hydroxychromene-2-carboxylate isomerase